MCACTPILTTDGLCSSLGTQRSRPVDPSALALLAVHRKCKDFGRYRFVIESKQDARYATALERARKVVLEQLSGLPPELERLASRLRRELGEVDA